MDGELLAGSGTRFATLLDTGSAFTEVLSFTGLLVDATVFTGALTTGFTAFRVESDEACALAGVVGLAVWVFTSCLLDELASLVSERVLAGCL